MQSRAAKRYLAVWGLAFLTAGSIFAVSHLGYANGGCVGPDSLSGGPHPINCVIIPDAIGYLAVWTIALPVGAPEIYGDKLNFYYLLLILLPVPVILLEASACLTSKGGER